LILRQKERWAAQRIRRSHRELTEILDFKRTTHDPSGNPIPARTTPSGDLIFRGMLQQERRHPVSPGARQPINGTPTPAPGSEPNGNKSVGIQFIANRFEQILGNARDLAMHDPLTGLANRRYCIEHLEGEIHRAKEKQTLLALLFIDLDKFKSINDTYGHRIGDQALREVANHLQILCRQDDFLARYGGDEFILILNPDDTPNLSHESLTLHTQQVAHRILESFDNIQANSDSPYRISLSIGIAITAGNLIVGAGATAVAKDNDDYLIYDTTSDLLYYDADGNGAGSPLAFVKIELTGTAAPSFGNFLVVS
jgi:diguanylate cyclase (GGDEF)-like protein